VYEQIGAKEFEDLLFLKMSPDHMALVIDAYNFAENGHRYQKRDSGGRYFEHSKRVALNIILEFGSYDHEMIIAALLHDTVEDTPFFGPREEALENIQQHFNKWVARSVLLLSKEPCPKENKLERNRRYFDSIMNSADIRDKIIKCSDRLDNVRELEGCTKAKKRYYVDDTERYVLPMILEVADHLTGAYRECLLHWFREMSETCQKVRESLYTRKSSKVPLDKGSKNVGEK
jgi:(p)ppGpp synthase/HD superfamily hydrolase